MTVPLPWIEALDAENGRDDRLVAALALVRILREIRIAISSYDEQIEELIRAHPDFIIFDSFPGAGAALAPRLIAAFGTCRDLS